MLQSDILYPKSKLFQVPGSSLPLYCSFFKLSTQWKSTKAVMKTINHRTDVFSPCSSFCGSWKDTLSCLIKFVGKSESFGAPMRVWNDKTWEMWHYEIQRKASGQVSMHKSKSSRHILCLTDFIVSTLSVSCCLSYKPKRSLLSAFIPPPCYPAHSQATTATCKEREGE